MRTSLISGLRRGPQGREGWVRSQAYSYGDSAAPSDSGCLFPIQSRGRPSPRAHATGLSSLLPAAASRMIANSLNRDSPPGTPPRRPDTSTSKISVTVSNKMAAKNAKAAGEGTWAGGGRRWR